MFRSTRPLLIVVGGTDPVYRGYCVEQAATAYPIALIDTKPPSWQQHLVVDHEVAPVAVQAVQALGVTDGVQHVEMRLTASGPRIIEVNARIGGDLIGKLVRLATGLDLPRIAADIACGQIPDLTPTAHATAAIKMLYPPATGILSARNLAIVPGPKYPWLHQVTWLRDVGERVVVPPTGKLDTGRVGFLIATADSPEAAQYRLSSLANGLTLSVTP